MKIIVTASTFPAHSKDRVPDFVLKQLLALRKINENYDFIVHTPFTHVKSAGVEVGDGHLKDVVRYHYFFPRRFELLAGRGIMASLKSNKALYLLIPFFCVANFLTLWSLSLRHKPDLIYSHWFTPQAISAFLVSKLTGVPFIFTTHASDVSILRKIPFASTLVRAVCRNASAYTAVSQKTASKLKSFFNDTEWERYGEKLSVLPMGVDRPQCNSFPPIGKALKILFIGRFVEKKGVPILIQSVSLVRANNCFNFEVSLVGEGLEEEAYRDLVCECGLENYFRFHGYLHGIDKDAALRAADVVCVPSINTDDGDEEGLPVVILEALSYGKLVVASRDSGAGEVIDHGVNGYLTYTNSPMELAQRLQEIYESSDEDQKIIRRNAMKSSLAFSWESLSVRYDRLISGVLEQQKSAKGQA